jgi:HEAT repeat protein
VLELLKDWAYRPAVPVAEKLVEDPDSRVSRAAFALITTLAGRSQLGSLRRSLENGEDPIRLLAAEALRKFDDESGFEIVVEILRDGLVTERRDAARILGGFRRRGSIPPLIDALADEDASVSTIARTSIQQVVTALFPYRRFDWNAIGLTTTSSHADRKKAAALLRAWWASIPKE